jgi:hypothetical protein
MKYLYFLLLAFLLSANAHSAPTISGKYVSLNGKYKHDFKPSGDYSGVAKHEKEQSGTGLYEQADEICWLPKNDGSKGPTGNVIIYVGEAQCCLEFKQISNKFAVSKIWIKGTGVGYALCHNQVLQKQK